MIGVGITNSATGHYSILRDPVYYLCPMLKTFDSFSDFKLNKQLLQAVQDKGYQKPTPVQCKAIPQILAGHNVIGIAQTGTGKTAAYILPMLKNLSHAQGSDPRALILLPTRELALQVGKELADFSCYTDLRFAVIYGGTGAKIQIENIAKGIDILVATPGRLLELYLDGHLILKKIRMFILDEAERLMDMGFIGQLHRILEVVPRKRQNLLFSATMSDLVKKIAGDFLSFPILIHIEPEQKTVSTVTQEVYFTPNRKTKINLLDFLFKNEKELHKVIIFCKTKEEANNLFKYIGRKYGEEKIKVIHGNKAQTSRIHAVNEFLKENVRWLISTDVAARGLDIPSISHVINFDVPLIPEDYVHRIGRTGRAMHTGSSITFCNEADQYHLQKIEKLIKQHIEVKVIPTGVFIEATGYDERQEIAREIDRQLRKEDPEFKGAFHVKKKPINPVKSGRQKRKRK